jgi:hypothetical protein
MNRALFAFLFGLVLLTPGPALMAQTSPAGHWEGDLVLPNQKLTITVDLLKNDAGEWSGNFGVPAQGVSGLRLDKIQIDGKNVKFVVPDAPGAPELSGALKDDGHLAVTFTQAGASFPADLKRTGEAKVEISLPSPAVDPKFEGDWAGDINAPQGALRAVFHIKNQPDKTVKATFDSPDQNAFGLPLVEIVQKDNVIELHLKIAQGAYKGTLSADGTELAGEFAQRGLTLPLTLKKAAK